MPEIGDRVAIEGVSRYGYVTDITRDPDFPVEVTFYNKDGHDVADDFAPHRITVLRPHIAVRALRFVRDVLVGLSLGIVLFVLVWFADAASQGTTILTGSCAEVPVGLHAQVC